MTRRSWVATGFYGQKNYGDDLFCLVISRLMRYENLACIIQNGYIYSNEKIRLPTLKFPPQVISNKGVLGKAARVLSNIQTAMLGKNVVFGGGSVFGRHASYRQRLLTTVCGALFGSNFFAFGVSVGPFSSRTELQKYASMLKKFKYVCVRDGVSAKFLEDCGVSCNLGPDMAWVLPSLIEKSSSQSTKTAVVAMHSLDCLPAMRELEDFFSQFGKVFLIALDKGSVNVSNALEETYRRGGKVCVERFNYFDSPIERTIELFSSAHYVVTSKLHGAITAAAYGVPFSLFEYQAKCSDFLREVDFPVAHLNGGDYSKFTKSTREVYQEGVLVPTLGRSQLVVNRFLEMVACSRKG